MSVQVEASWAVVSALSVRTDHIGTGIETLAIDKEFAGRTRNTVGGRSKAVEAARATELAAGSIMEVVVRTFLAALFVEQDGSLQTRFAFICSIYASFARRLASDADIAEGIGSIRASSSA